MTLCKPKRREKLFSTRSAESNFSFSETKFRDKYSRWMSCEPAVSDYILADAESAKKLPAGGVYTLNNLSLYHYSNNNPIKYVDPDGQISIYYQSRGLYSNPTYTAIPFGGGLTQEQTDAKKAVSLMRIGIGILGIGAGAVGLNGAGFFLQTVNSFSPDATMSSATFDGSMSILGELNQTVGTAASTIKSVVDVMNAINSSPNSNKLTSEQKNNLAKIAVEQSFAKDFADKAKEKWSGVQINYSGEGKNRMIANVQINDFIPENDIKNLMQQVKDSKPELYKDVEIESR